MNAEGRSVTQGETDDRDRTPSLGERLRAARQAQPLSLAQISAELRIEAKFLEALEADRLDAFPAPVFAKGFLKQYGGLLGLDERDLLAQYYRQVDVRDAPVVHHKPIRLRDEDQIRHWLAAGLVLILLAGGASIWWTTRPGLEPLAVEPAIGPLDTLPAPPAAPAPESRPEPAPGIASAATVDAGPATVAETPAADGAAGAEAVPADVETAEIGPEPAGTLVELNFLEDCWTEISDARGERLFYGLGSAGARARFSASLPISVFFGNVGGVELAVNGNRYPIPAGSRQGNLARFVVAEPGL
ncbi:MAG TPA: RodZ domain-containing protein [Gammaproteobacteria bacterium]|nr:RodZ domain-containing protein [Gammaproteobacteria bacterium]